MATANELAGEDVQKIIRTIHANCESAREDAARESKCTIFRVPAHICRGREDLFRPHMLSVGPYHHGKEDLRKMEKMKWVFLLEIRERKPGCLEACVERLKDLEAMARSCYFHEVHFDRHEFIEMLLLDGCFIIQLFIKQKSGGIADTFLESRWIFGMIKQDLLLLENQIPFFVLHEMYDLISVINSPLNEIAMDFLRPWDFMSRPANTPLSNIDVNDIHHLLHFFYCYHIQRPAAASTSQRGTHLSNSVRTLEWLRTEIPVPMSPSASRSPSEPVAMGSSVRRSHSEPFAMSSSASRSHCVPNALSSSASWPRNKNTSSFCRPLSRPASESIATSSSASSPPSETSSSGPSCESVGMSSSTTWSLSELTAMSSSASRLLFESSIRIFPLKKKEASRLPSKMIPSASRSPSVPLATCSTDSKTPSEPFAIFSSANRNRPVVVIPSATRLVEAGVKLRKKRTENFLDINFRNGTLEIPSILINEAVTYRLANLLALEQYLNVGKDITSYATFMDCLIDTSHDVEILRRKGIMEKVLSSNKEVAGFFNHLCAFSPLNNRHYLLEVFEEVDDYCKSSWHENRAKLVRDYFSNPWASISMVAAMVLLSLTFLQTFMSFYSYYHNRSS